MKAHPGAARTLALAALLALLGGARAGASGEACGPHTTPKITVNAIQKRFGDYTKSYGEDIIIHCSAKNGTHLEMEENNKSQQIMEVNTTTVQVFVTKPKLGVYRYSCVDGETGCQDSLTVKVRPTMSVWSVESSKVYFKPPYKYFVPLGEDFEVFCSGHDSEALSIVVIVDGKRLQTDCTVINSTSIKHRTQADRVNKTSFFCISNVRPTAGDEDTVLNFITVTVDYYPNCYNFSCVLYKSNRALKCSWNYSTHNIDFKLFYTDLTEGDGATTLLCSDTSGDTTGSCTVNEEVKGRDLFYRDHNVSFLFMSCNLYFLCNNQSITVNTDAISKSSPVYFLEVLNTSAHGIALRWSNSYTNPAHKIEYRQIKLDDDWQLAAVASLRCDFWRCVCKLALPYPDAEYEVRVYARHEAATDDRVWSEPVSLLVTTEPLQECGCSAAPDTPADPTTTMSREGARCKVCTDTEKTIKESLALKYKINSLKKNLKNVYKLIQVNKLLNNQD